MICRLDKAMIVSSVIVTALISFSSWLVAIELLPIDAIGSGALDVRDAVGDLVIPSIRCNILSLESLSDSSNRDGSLSTAFS